MSYPITETIGLTPVVVAEASYTPDISGLPTTTDDDVVWLYVTAGPATGNTGTLSIAGAGWQTVVEQNSLNNPKVGLYYCVVASGAVAQPTVSLSTGTAGWLGTAWVERDCEVATDPVDSYVISDSTSNVTSRASAAHTPSTDGCRIVWLSSGRLSGSTPQQRMLEVDSIGENFQAIFETASTIAICQVVGSAVQDTAASTVKTVYHSASMRSNVITLAIQNKAGGKRAKSASVGLSRILWGGNFGNAHDATLTPALSSRDNPTSRTINGIAVNTTGTTFVSDSGGPVTWGSFDGWSTVSNTGWDGKALNFSADIDMTGKLFTMEFYVGNTAFFNKEGLIVVLEDSTGANWAAFQLSQVYKMTSSILYTAIIDPAGATYDDSGTFDVSTVRKITPLVHRLAVTTARSFFTRHLNLLSKTTLTGGNSADPLDINYLRKALQGWSCDRLVGGEAPAITIKSDVQIADGGTTPTYFDATGTLLTFPDAYNPLSQREWQVGTARTITLYPGASDTLNNTATTMATSTPQNLTIDVSASTSAAHSEIGMSVVGPWDVTWKTGIDPSGQTFSGTDQVNFKGSDVTNATITGTTSTNAAASWDGNNATLTTSTIDLTGTAAEYHIALGAAVTGFTANGSTLAGTPGTTKFYSALASGTLTITTDGTGTALADTDVTFIGGSTAVAVIAAPELYQSVAITGLATTYRLQIFDIEYDLTVSGITVTPTAGATYTHNGITWTVRATSITAGSGTITVYGTGTPATSGTLTKTAGTGDASVVFSAYAVGGTQLYQGVTGATSYTWTDSVAAAAPRVIRVRVMEDGPGTSDAIEMIDAIVGQCGVTEGTEAVGYLVAAVADDVYNDRGVDGSTITGITIDDATLRFEIASGTVVDYDGVDVLVIDGRDIYAYETYWLGTAAGIIDEARIITAVDAANFRCDRFKFRNDTVYPVLIVNAYMVDAATGIFATLVDYSGGQISNGPDHVAVQTITTSDAVVSGTLAQFIAAVPTANDNATAVWSKILP